MNRTKLIASIMSLALWAANASAYEVWMGTHLMTHADATNLSTWSMAASQIEGVNTNRAPHDTDPASSNDYKTVYAQFTNAQNAMAEFARSQATRDPDKTDELAFPSIAARLEEIFAAEITYGYDLSIIMFYDERGTFLGTEYLYEWTEIEIQYLRDWLDTHGHDDVELMWNVRNNSVRNQQLAVNPLVDSVEIEASTTAFLANTNHQRTFFDWFWTNPATANKRIALQLPRTLDSLNQYKGTRRVAQSLGTTIGYGEDGMRSDRLVFLPVTYNDNFPYTPETVSSGTAYTNTLTSIALSLIEQRQLFEGRLPQLPTVADADSTVRTAPPTITTIGDQVTSVDQSTAAIPFTIADTDTPVGSLTLTATSSNQALVPSSGIVLGGAGGSRTITVTPASGQSGTSEITVMVSDGVWYAESSFTLTVGGLLLSQAADANVKDNFTLVDQGSTTTQLGAGGSSPFVDRCTVYVFQLPDLGPGADPFTGASFSFNYESKDGSLKNNDLYGLGRRNSATVLGSDYYGQSATSDPSDAELLQTEILTNSTPFGVVGTSLAGDAALVDYLNAQYASGVGIGEYVILRLNTTAPKDGINRAILTMSEGGVINPSKDTRPRIAYTIQSGPGITGLSDTSINQDTTAAIPFSITNLGTTGLSVSATSSNTDLVPNAGIVITGSGLNRTLNITPTAGMGGQTEITVMAINGSDSVSVGFTLSVLRVMLATVADAEVQPTLSTPSHEVLNEGANSLLVGTAGGNVGKDRCVVFPFLLPDLGAVANPFYSASFTVDFTGIQSPPVGNVSVYGLGARDADTVLPSDYWSATSATDTTDATLLQSILIPSGSTNFGLKTSDVTGSANLVAYLNGQYGGGVGAGKYVFLRLSADAAQSGGSNRYVFTSADGALAASDDSIHPRIDFLTTGDLETPLVTMVVLGTAVDLTAGSTWSDGLPPHADASYIVPDTGNLRGENGTSVFPGLSLTVEAGGKFQVRAIEDNGELTTVDQLMLVGGGSFGTGDFAELAAGTGTGVTNVLDGTITNSGYSRLLTYGMAGGGTVARSLKVLSLISGSGRIQVVENSADGLSSVIIENPANAFFGTWEVAGGSTLVFENAGAVGTADIDLQSGGSLEIKGDWTQNAILTVADDSGTEVKVGANEWTLSSLVLGGTPVADGIYSPSELSGLGNALFSGTGRITVGTPIFTQEVVAGWDFWNSNTAPAANVTGSGITATATASTASGNWSTTDDSSSGRGSSGDTTWGSFDGNGLPASAVTSGAGSNMTAFNGVTTAELTLTITNNGAADWDLDGFHMDVIAFRQNAPRAYQLEVLSGDITHGVVFTSTDDEINELGGTLSGNHDDHDEIDLSLLGLADSTLDAGETAVIRITFSSGTGSGAGHHLFLDNVAVTGVLSPVSELQSWRFEHFGTIENSGTAADSYDSNFDGESNLLEFATGQDPHAGTLLSTPVEMNGANLEFRYTRSKAALADGMVFRVEWSDTLLEGSWSTVDVVDSLDSENPGDSELENRIASIPEGASGKRFVHLKVSR